MWNSMYIKTYIQSNNFQFVSENKREKSSRNVWLQFTIKSITISLSIYICRVSVLIILFAFQLLIMILRVISCNKAGVLGTSPIEALIFMLNKLIQVGVAKYEPLNFNEFFNQWMLNFLILLIFSQFFPD